MLSLCCLIFVGCNQRNSSHIRFGLIADIQYCDCETNGNRYYRNSLEKLDECVTELNTEKVSFTINLGDLVDRDAKNSLKTVLLKLDKLNTPVYNLPGNHDYAGVTNNEELYKQLKMPASYYSFVRKGWRFIALNTNEVSLYANVMGTPLEEELDEMILKIEEMGRKNGASYNGGISSRQLNWLRAELETAKAKKENVLIFSHHPLYAASGLTALNDLVVTELLTKYSCVKGVISGHHHSGDYGVYKNIPFIVTEGMIETADENAYGIVDIYSDKIVLTGKGRTKCYTIPIRR